VGTPAFMAPEQVSALALDARADLFSLGCVLYVLCTGMQPFKGDDVISTLMAVAAVRPRPPRELAPEGPRALSGLVMRLLCKDPEGRPPNALAVAEELSLICRQGDVPLRGWRRRTLVAVLGVLLTIAAAVVVIHLRTEKGEVTVQTNDPSIELVVR